MKPDSLKSTARPAATIFLQGGTKSYGSTCNLTVPPAVAIPAAPQSQFTGIGTVPAARKDFNMSVDCSGIVAGQVVGVSFSASSRHASGAAGVIAVSEGDGKAAGVALQIVNTTSGRPIAFNALERGTPPPALNGTYNSRCGFSIFRLPQRSALGRSPAPRWSPCNTGERAGIWQQGQGTVASANRGN